MILLGSYYDPITRTYYDSISILLRSSYDPNTVLLRSYYDPNTILLRSYSRCVNIFKEWSKTQVCVSILDILSWVCVSKSVRIKPGRVNQPKSHNQLKQTKLCGCCYGRYSFLARCYVFAAMPRKLEVVHCSVGSPTCTQFSTEWRLQRM